MGRRRGKGEEIKKQVFWEVGVFFLGVCGGRGGGLE